MNPNSGIEKMSFWPDGFDTPANFFHAFDQILADRAFWRCKPSFVELIRPSNTNNPNTEEANWSRQVCACRYTSPFLQNKCY